MLIDLFNKVVEFNSSYFSLASLGNYKIYKENGIVKISAQNNKGLLDYYFSVTVSDNIYNEGNSSLTNSTMLYRTGNTCLLDHITDTVTDFAYVTEENLDELEFQYSTLMENHEAFLFCSYLAHNFPKNVMVYSSHFTNKVAMQDVWENIKDEQYTV